MSIERGKKSSKTALGQSIIQGVNEAIAWASGEDVAVRENTVHVPKVDVKKVRTRMGLSQTQFARRFGFSASCVRNWEQGRREPELPARILLAVIDRKPEIVEQILSGGL